MPDPAGPLVSIVIVTYNARGHLAEGVAALLADTESPASELWLVDNASPDGTGALAEALAAEHAPRVRCQRNPVNLGYAGGVNSVLLKLSGEYVAVLNPDCRVMPGWLTPLTDLLRTEPRAGAVCPLLLLQADGRINAAGQDAHLSGLGFNRLMWRPAGQAGVRPTRVSGLHGGAFVTRRALLEQMGGWEDSGFLYHEDVELSWLIQLMGYDLYCQPEARVLHDYHLTMYPEKLFLLERNRWAMLLTYLHWPARLLLTPWLLLTEAMIWGYCLLRGPAFRRAKWDTYRWLVQHPAELTHLRQRIAALRQRRDRDLLGRLRWNYNWDQFLGLGRERGPSTRQPAGGLPTARPEA